MLQVFETEMKSHDQAIKKAKTDLQKETNRLVSQAEREKKKLERADRKREEQKAKQASIGPDEEQGGDLRGIQTWMLFPSLQMNVSPTQAWLPKKSLQLGSPVSPLAAFFTFHRTCRIYSRSQLPASRSTRTLTGKSCSRTKHCSQPRSLSPGPCSHI